MSNFYLKIEAIPGAHIAECIKDAIRIAQILNVTVAFNHNGVKCLVNPTTDPQKLEEKWDAALKDKSTRPKIVSA